MDINRYRTKFSPLSVEDDSSEFKEMEHDDYDFKYRLNMDLMRILSNQRGEKQKHICLHLVCCVHIIMFFILFVYFCYQYYRCESTVTKSLQTETAGPTLYIWVTGGCSMSSHLFGFSKFLLKAYGVDVLHLEGTWEFNHKRTNPLFHEDAEDQAAPTVALFELWNVAVAKKRSVIIKFDGGIGGDEWNQASLRYALHNIIPTKVAFAYRGNFLDRLVCMVRDCFTNTFGLSVDASNGLPNNLCFKRRLSKNKTQARLFPNKLMDGLKYAEAEVDRIDDIVNRNFHLDRNHPNNTRVKTEALWGFESSSNWTDSIQAWANVLHAWGFEAEPSRIRWIMKKWIRREIENKDNPDENTTMHLEVGDYEKMKQRRSHYNSIYNLDELLETFGNDERFLQYLHI